MSSKKHVAAEFHSLITDVKRNELKAFEEARAKDREAQAELRRQSGAGKSMSEIISDMVGEVTKEERLEEIDAHLSQLKAEAEEAASAKETHVIETTDKFPDPVLTTK
jgi:hypothetical protein